MELCFVIYYILIIDIYWVASLTVTRGPTTCHGPTIPNTVESYFRHNISYKTRRPETTKRIFTKKSWIRPKSCEMPPAVGPCVNIVTRSFYNKKTDTCEEFKYGGCLGNGNRFPTKEECIDYCITGATAKNTQPDYCKPTHAYGDCMGNMDRWAYDRVFKTCKTFIYSGCGGNPNNFRTREQCEASCVLVTNDEVALSNYWRTGPERVTDDNGTLNTNFTALDITSEKTSERMKLEPKIEIHNKNGSIVNFELNTNLGNDPEIQPSPNINLNANINDSLRAKDIINETDMIKVNDTMKENYTIVNDTIEVNDTVANDTKKDKAPISLISTLIQKVSSILSGNVNVTAVNDTSSLNNTLKP